MKNTLNFHTNNNYIALNEHYKYYFNNYFILLKQKQQ